MHLPSGALIQRRSSARRINSSETKGASGKNAPREERGGGLDGLEKRRASKNTEENAGMKKKDQPGNLW